MNKFPGPDDGCYVLVRQKIEKFLHTIRRSSSILHEADAQIIQSYQHDTDRLEVERLSGEILPMDQCYINLSIVARDGNSSAVGEISSLHASSSSPWRRRSPDQPPGAALIELRDIFNTRHQRGQDIQPRRIYIQGRPGVGKTTLCKKVVYEYIHDGAWKDLFDRLLWIPLRNLTDREDRYDLSKLFHDEFFSQCTRKDDFVRAMVKECDERGGERTLFILDGLDETWHDISHHGIKRHCVLKLLNMPNVIVTTRPSVTLPAQAMEFDLELETIGFNPDQVAAYITKLEPHNASTIKSFLNDHPLMKDLARIPIQLDALCFAWKDVHDHQPETITDLYVAIHNGIWRRDTQRLGQDAPGTMMLLEEIAFLGMLHDKIVLSSPFLEKTCNHLHRQGYAIYNNLSKVSFLRASATSSPQHSKGSFHFLHLTLQEYFAARHVVRKWSSGEVVAGQEDLDATAFFLEHRYAARYDVVWRFVAGLLSNEGKGKEFFDKVDQEPKDLLGLVHQRLTMRCLNEVSPTLGQQTGINLRGEIEERLSKWLVNVSKEYDPLARLVDEPEFPEKCLVDVIQLRQGRTLLGSIPNKLMKSFKRRPKWTPPEHFTEMRLKALKALGNRRNLSESTIEAIVQCLGDQTSQISWAAERALNRRPNISESAIKTILLRLHDQNWRVRQAALSALGNRLNHSGSTVKAIVQCLGDENWQVRQAAVGALKDRPSLSEAAVEAVVRCLGDESSQVRQAAVGALKNQPSLSEVAVEEAIVQCLGDANWQARRAAVDALKDRPSLSEPAIEAIVRCLDDRDLNVKVAAVEALKDRPDISERRVWDRAIRDLVRRLDHAYWVVEDVLRGLPNVSEPLVDSVRSFIGDLQPATKLNAVSILTAWLNQSEWAIDSVVKAMDDEHWDVVQAAVHSLKGSSPTLSDSIARAIVRRWEKEKRNFRIAATDVLISLPDLSESAAAAVRSYLNHANNRWATAGALKTCKSLSKLAIEASMWCLGDQDSRIRLAALGALEKHPTVCKSVIEEVVRYLGDEESGIREAAIRALKFQQNLSKSAIEAIVLCLGDQTWRVRSAALDALGTRINRSESTVRAIIQCLGDENWRVRLAAMGALKNQLSLSEAAVEAVVRCLSDESSQVRRAAVDALKDRPSLSEPAIEAIMQRLGDGDWRVRLAAMGALKNQPSLSEAAVEAVVRCLSDESSQVRQAAVGTLENRLDHSETTVQAIVQCLVDGDWRVRLAAVDVLNNLSSISQSVVDALCKQRELDRGLMLRLIQHDAFHEAFLAYRAGNLFDALLSESKKSHVAWCVQGSTSTIQTEQGKHIAKHRGSVNILNVVQRRRRKLGVSTGE